jgi:hypothetical protein
MKIPSKTILIAVIIFCSIASSFAWLRRHFSDEEIVSRATLIVVGHICDASLIRVEHPKDVVGGQSWEHHVDLEISEVLKGQTPSNSMVVSIHYGLDPGVIPPGAPHDWQWVRATNYQAGAVRLWDTGNSGVQFSPFTGDIRTNHIWLLRQVQKPVNDDTDWIGIYDPEDIQPMSKKSELMTYLK